MKQLELTPRLQTIASMVPCGCRMADIGTDHAYLPVWLLNHGRIPGAIAADLREGPLERARITAEKYMYQGEISFRLCDGLAAIRPNEVETVVIAGMGGETIASILERAPWIASPQYTLLLQPMSAQSDLRHWLWSNGYNIVHEELIFEGKKIYNIFDVRFGKAKSMSLGEEWAGRQYKGMIQPLRGLYLERLLEKTSRAICGLTQGNDEKSRKRLEELEQVRRELEEIKKEWESWQR